MKHRHALILFVPNPDAATQLSAALGEQKAAEIQQDILRHTMEHVSDVRADYHVFYMDEIPETDRVWDELPHVKKQLQLGAAALEARMNQAFEATFQHDYEKIMLVCAESLDLDASILTTAFQMLDDVDVVLGPLKQGGIYLLGMKEPWEELFLKPFSSTNSFEVLLHQLMEAGLVWHELPMLRAITNEDDLATSRAKKLLRELREKSLHLQE